MEIRRVFEKVRACGGVGCSIVAVWGTGGLGKTRLAAEFAHIFAHEHEALLYVSASSEETLNDSLANLCCAMKLSESTASDRNDRIAAALRWLDDPARAEWLLIVDNIDDEEARRAVEVRLRSLHRGRVILTGRLREWPTYVTPVHLDVLAEDDAAKVLLDHTNKLRAVDPAGPAADEMHAREIARELGGLALALIQAASAIRKRVLTFSEYLSEWRQNRQDLLDEPAFDPILTGYPRTVAYTWQTSYSSLSPASKFLFDALCWLSHEPIPSRIIAQQWPEDALGELAVDMRAQLPARRQDLLIPLYGYCLAEAPTAAGRTLSIHRVTQDVGRRWQQQGEDSEGIAQRQRLATSLVMADFVRPVGTHNLTLHRLPELVETAPHAAALVEQVDVPADARCQLARVLSEVAAVKGDNAAALRHARAAAELGEQGRRNDGIGQLTRIRAISQLVSVFVQRGEVSDAIEHGTRMLEEISGWEAFEDTTRLVVCAESIRYVGRAYELRGEQDKALALFEKSRQICMKLCDREPDDWAHLRALGIALNDVGRVWEQRSEVLMAYDLFKQSLKISERLCECESDNLAHKRERGFAFDNVGRVLEQQGEHTKAMEFFEKGLQISEDLCEREPENLAHQRELGIALDNVGRVWEQRGDHVRAHDLFDRSLCIRERLITREPANLAHKRDLSIALHNVGRVKEKQNEHAHALRLYEQCHRIRQELYQRDPDNLVHQRDLGVATEIEGRVRETLGNIDQAMELYEECRKIREELCKRDPDNLAGVREFGIAINHVGDICEKRGDYVQAVKLFEQCRQIRERICMSSPDSLANQRELASAIFKVGCVKEKQGDYNNAVELFEHCRRISENLCLRDPSNVDYQREFGIVLYYCGNACIQLEHTQYAKQRLKEAQIVLERLPVTGNVGDIQGIRDAVHEALVSLEH